MTSRFDRGRRHDATPIRTSSRCARRVAPSRQSRRQLGVRRAKDVYATFHRTLASRPEDERGELVLRELERLAVLEARIRTRDAAEPEKMARRLEALEHMRQDLH